MSLKCLFGFHDWQVVKSVDLHKIEELAEKKLMLKEEIIEIKPGDLDKPSCACYLGLPELEQRICLRCGKHDDQISRRLIEEYNKLVRETKRSEKALELLTRKIEEENETRFS